MQQPPPEQPNPYQNQETQQPMNPYQNQGNQQPLHPSERSNDGYAITSMVLGIVAVLTCYFGIILGTVAVIFGHLSLGKIKKNPQIGGKGMAIAGLATGYVAITFSIVAGIILLVTMNTVREEGRSIFQDLNREIKKEHKRKMEQNK